MIATVITLLLALQLPPVDQEWLRAWEAAQKPRPAKLTSVARIAPATEPGTPLTIRGRVTETDGKRVVANAIVFAYHTDRTGVYNVRGSRPHTWRLRGWAKTDAQGRFTFHTIRPGQYPNRREPAHVHFAVTRANGRRYNAADLTFVEGRAAPAAEITLKLEESKRF